MSCGSGWLRSALISFLALSGCDGNTPEDGAADSLSSADLKERWYSQAQVELGATVFARHCAACHGDRAQGTEGDWRIRRPDGSLPPPPLDGSAHAWHHSLPVLLRTIEEGGAALGGTMPGFAEQLNRREMEAAVAWFQNLWSDEIYRKWLEMGGTGR